MAFPLKIFSLEREIFVGNAKSLSVPTVNGQIQVLPEHAALVTLLKAGEVVAETEDGTTHKIPIAGGTVEVNEHEVVALVNF
ncbi:MAG: hypothetical protein A3E07_00015 [Candidatus Wildermuthbacteria bacterium RIFCSPHIGHO2_12_FULL_45_9]|uniref:ATP synthase F1 complex delta/epsilon subunit N-terminal domain-containing protein n=1 Tax=Candidatus Wildermuthbacteria bacterium RIFCSPHIGHO2_02_FULL_45_25 TaxID=1802450 RepID=A0A1G2R541_9BACT|nr:MAG: hypothetical protein A2748_00735 [Candidatus Wildermuthbacteria bacterium RIFCSPHIGHO2_01_FULL_45_20]OHA67499.1 MAG: hypothetical protein A3C04_00275 [Candidatus Wildermuthbacteria bacterium RIFCSPHIGHO2_02_FULL_45_25]OHA72112.1 MAG: hypothetical protein A3E07_00015 [Candidatus Wildermuthbacteria bacterium RIFCSPHIGHO2_12_FULL_45_9]